jgi:hypothetical protein
MKLHEAYHLASKPYFFADDESMPKATDTPSFCAGEEFVDNYGEKSGRDLRAPVHGFGCLKLAAILQQIYARWREGQKKDERFAKFEKRGPGAIFANSPKGTPLTESSDNAQKNGSFIERPG